MLNKLGNDFIENNFFTIVNYQCEIFIKSKDINFDCYYNIVFKFTNTIVQFNINDNSKIKIITDFLKYLNENKTNKLLFEKNVCILKHFFIYLIICAKEFGPIGKQIFFKPQKNNLGIFFYIYNIFRHYYY